MSNKNSINSSNFISPIDFAREMLKNTAGDGTLYLNEWCDDNNYKVRFKKIDLKKGTEKTVEFILTPDDFTHINEDGEKEYLSSDKFNIFIEK